MKRHPPGADADIIRVCAEHAINVRAFNTAHCEADDGPLETAYIRTQHAIDAARPQTIEGMLAKACAAKAETIQPDGSENPEHCPAADWAWDLLNDLLRLHGGVA